MRFNPDPYGRVQVDIPTLKKLLYAGKSLQDVYAMDCPRLRQYNALCDQWDRPQFKISGPPPLPHSPEDEHRMRQSRWSFPEEMSEIDVREFVLDLCDDDAQRARVNEEMDLFEHHGLEPVLRLMIYLVGMFRLNGHLWGVGRGSSVASYVLFKIGVHKIDAMKYGLPISDFLKA